MPSYAPLRLLVLRTAALMVVGALVSSSACALVTAKVGLEPTTAAGRHNPPASSGTGEARIASGVIQVAATGDTARVTQSVPRDERPAVEAPSDTWWTITIGGGGLVIIILGAILLRQARATPGVPQWSRGMARTGPESVTNLSAPPAMLSRSGAATASMRPRGAPTTPSGSSAFRNAAPTLPNRTTASKPERISRSVPRTMSKPTPTSRMQDTSLDTLLDDIDADLADVRAVREVHAAARRDFEHDLGGNAILQAIEDAERDLLLGSSAATEAAMDSSLDGALMAPKQRPGKAAA